MKTGRAELKARARQCLKGNFGVAAGGILLYYGISWLLSSAMQIVTMIGSGSSTIFSVLTSGTDDLAAMGSFMTDSKPILIVMIALMIIMYLVTMVVMYLLVPGLIRMHMNICNGQKANVGDLFWAFRNRPVKFAGIGVLILLAMMVLMIPLWILIAAAVVSGDTKFLAVFMVIYMAVLMVVMAWWYLNFAMFYYILVEDPEKGIIEALKESHQLMKGNRCRYLVMGLSWLGWEIFALASFGIGYLWILPYIYCTSVYFYQDLKPQVETIPPERSWDF